MCAPPLVAATLLFAGLAMLALDTGLGAQTSSGLGDWRIAGHDLDNSRNQPLEKKIGTENVNQLVPKWVFETGSDVSATPTVAGNTAGSQIGIVADLWCILNPDQMNDVNPSAACMPYCF